MEEPLSPFTSGMSLKNAMTIEKMDMKELANSSGNDTAASLWHDRCAQASASAMPACAPGACNDRAAGRTGARRSSSCGNRSRTARQARARRRYRRQPRTASASSASAARRQSRTSRAPGCGCHKEKRTQSSVSRMSGATAGCIAHQKTSVAISGGELATYPAERSGAAGVLRRVAHSCLHAMRTHPAPAQWRRTARPASGRARS
jgi:hypothetical protein